MLLIHQYEAERIFKTQNIYRDQKGHYFRIKGSFYQKSYTFLDLKVHINMTL